jgi:hypothetical protein
VLVALLVPAVALGQQVRPTRTASVTYLGPDWLFIDAGSAEGLRQGSKVEVVRRGRIIAVLRVESLDVHQANCAVVSRQVRPILGDSVRFTPITPRVVAMRPPVQAPRVTPPPRNPSPIVAPERAPASVVSAARPTDSTVAATVPRPIVVAPHADTAATVRFVSPAPAAAPSLVEQPTWEEAASRQGGTASVTYLGRDWLFIDAGSADGLRQGSEVEIVRRDRTIAVLRVESLGDHQANCSVVSHQLSPILGDSARFTPVGPPTPRAPVVAAPLPGDSTTAVADATPPRRATAPPRGDSTPTPTPAPAPTQVMTASRQGTTTATTASVTFMSGLEIYVSAGRREGLVEGAELSVVRRDSVVSSLRVKYVSSHQSSCEVIRGASDVVVGDVVRFVARVPAAGTSATATAARRHRPRRLSGPGLHGRLGMRYLRATSAVSADSSGTGTGSSGFNQPSFDLRLNGLGIGGTSLGLSVDLRTRRTVTSSLGQPNRVDGKTRVYQAAIFWGSPGAGFRTVTGRQYLAAVTSVGMFDGGLIELNGSHATVGLFGGLEPDAATLGFSGAIQDRGGYIQIHNRPGTAGSWSFTTGAVGSYEASQANREFGFVQASASNSHFSFYGLQEVDYYPSWKVQLGEKEFSFTSQYANALFRPSRWLSFNGSYDKRRSVRLYRDTQNPETTFDDAYRQGYGGGLQLAGRKVNVGADWRRSTGGTAGGADSYTGTFGLDRFTPLKLGLSARVTWYQNQNDSTAGNPGAKRTSGQLYSGRLGLDPVGPLHVDFNGGIRREDNPNTTTMQKSTWYGVDLDASVARAWFVSFSALRQTDPANPGTITTTQLYGSVTWRF